MPLVRRQGATVAYDVVGSGPAVVLGHSLFCTRAMWGDVLAALPRDRWRFVNVELRGHGESTAPKPFTIDDLVDDWLAILDAEGIDRAVLCGLSTGGMTAMRLAVRAPQRVAGLALLDTAAGGEPRVDRIEYALLRQVWLRLGILPEKALLAAMLAPATRRQRPELGRRLVEDVRRFDRAGLGHAMSAVLGREDFDPSRIDRPTLVLVGEHDAATPPTAARKIARRVPGARLEVIAGAAHLTALEQPEQVARLLEPFFAVCLG